MNVRTTNRLYRAAAATIGALSIAGLALAGTGTASAEPTTAAGPSAASEPVAAEPTILRAAARPPDDDEEEDELCLSLSMMRYRDTRLWAPHCRSRYAAWPTVSGSGTPRALLRVDPPVPGLLPTGRVGLGADPARRLRRGLVLQPRPAAVRPGRLRRRLGLHRCTDRRGWLRLEADDDSELDWIMRAVPRPRR